MIYFVIYFRDGKLYATVRTDTKTWTVAAPGFKSGEWQIVDVSWHPEVGQYNSIFGIAYEISYNYLMVCLPVYGDNLGALYHLHQCRHCTL